MCFLYLRMSLPSLLSGTTHSSKVQPKSESPMTLHHISPQDSTTVPFLGNVMEWGRKTSLIAIRRWQNLLAPEELLFYLSCLFPGHIHLYFLTFFFFFLLKWRALVNLSSLQLCGVSTATTLHSRGNRGPLRGHKLPPFLNWGDWAALWTWICPLPKPIHIFHYTGFHLA